MAKRSSVSFPDLTLDELRSRMKAEGVRQLLVKELASNDTSKNQPYLDGDMTITNILPTGDITAEVSKKGNEVLKASLPMFWLQPDGGIAPAPHAKLILYPQYPEARLSGFLQRATNAPSALMHARQQGRLLFLGITSSRRIVAWAVAPDSVLAQQLRKLGDLEKTGVFRIVPLESAESRTTRQILLDELGRIYKLDWIASRRMARDGICVACEASQCVGYTLEAELGISSNGRAEPDFHGWEIKASEVSSFGRPPAAKAITLMTPDPTGGYYKEEGPKAFVRKFGYPDRLGREDRLNFGGVHRAGQKHHLTGLTLGLRGFDKETGKIINPSGALELLNDDGLVAAEWNFATLISHWTRKHAQAAYVPAEVKIEPTRYYRYGSEVRLGEGTDFQLLLSAISSGIVVYDPGIKLENATQGKSKVKPRSQFRIGSNKIDKLYSSMTTVSVSLP